MTKEKYNKWQEDYRNYIDTVFFALYLFKKIF